MKKQIKRLLREGLESIITEERIAAKSIEGFNLVVPNEVKVMQYYLRKIKVLVTSK
jgi:hypothetical protein